MEVRKVFLESNAYTLLLELFENSVYNGIQIQVYERMAKEAGYSGVDDIIKSKPQEMRQIMVMFKDYAQELGGGEIDTDLLKDRPIYDEFKQYIVSKNPRLMQTFSNQELALSERKKL